jgi:23S rRNA pseudouridine1911/1915/1917 synthase
VELAPDETLDFHVTAEHADKRLDVFLATAMPDLSRSLLQRVVLASGVTVNEVVVRPSERLRENDVVSVTLCLPVSLSASPERIDLTVVYEDDALAVIDKPAGMVVHPAPGHDRGTLVNGLLHRYPQLRGGGDFRPGLVHRLDKDTSGLIVVALTASAQVNLAEQIRGRSMKREYLAVVSGHPETIPHLVDAPIGRDPRSRLKMAVGDATIRPRMARTRFTVERYMPGFSLIRARLETGRTHQIRVHLAHAGYPVAGDRVYGGAKLPGLSRQFLHATELEFTSPVTAERQRFTSPLPPELQSVLERLGGA